MRNFILAIDFDGTIVNHEFPNVGKLKPNAKEVINRLYDNGAKIIIWTCRTTQQFLDGNDVSTIFGAKKFLDDNGIKFNTINNNIFNSSFQPSPKIYADIYIDDKNLGGIPEDWLEIERMIYEHIKKYSI